MDAKKTIVITGIGIISPYGRGLAALEAGLLAGECRLHPDNEIYPGFEGCVSRVTDLPNDFDGRHSRTDRMAMLAARDAASDLSGTDLLRTCGVVMASTVAGLSEIDCGIASDPRAWYRHGGLARAKTYPIAHVATSVSDDLQLEGPCSAVSVACASGSMAIALAANLLLDGAAPRMLAGGSDALCAFTLSGFNSLQALDRMPCRPFDQSRKGLNIGEGAAVLLLETLAEAQRRNAPILAVLRGWGMSNDASHPTAPHKEGEGIALCLERALSSAHCTQDEIGYVNAHGTGTPLNDIAETRGYERGFARRKEPIPVSSTKSYFGHCLGAAGALEAAITILSLRRGILFPTLRLETPVQTTKVEYLRELRSLEIRTAASLSAGFGGSNAALIFDKEVTA